MKRRHLLEICTEFLLRLHCFSRHKGRQSGLSTSSCTTAGLDHASYLDTVLSSATSFRGLPRAGESSVSASLPEFVGHSLLFVPVSPCTYVRTFLPRSPLSRAEISVFKSMEGC